MIINNNIAALNTHRQMGINQNAMQNAMEKLSSGLRINRAGDDAAGLAISEKMRAQINGLDQASRNAQDGISMIQTAEGALNETHSILQRMRELATQAANDTNVDVDRNEIQKEINSLTSEINRIGNSTEFNTQKLLNGGVGGAAGEPGSPGVAASGTTTVEGATVTAAGGTNAAYNDITIEFSTDTTAGASFADNTITISLVAGTDYTASQINDLIANITEESPEGVSFSNITLSTTDAAASFSGTQWAAADDIALANGEAGTPGAPGTADGFSSTFQIGANNGQSMTIGILDMRAEALGLSSSAAAGAEVAGSSTSSLTGKAAIVENAAFVSTSEVNDGTNNTSTERALSVATHEQATAAIEVINNAIEAVSAQRSELGSYQNRLDHTISNLNNSSENLSAAESRIRDVDMAKEMMEMTRANILSQASQSMLAQANQRPQSVLQLLG